MEMATFDLSAVQNFAADLRARLDRCDIGEGMECATLDASLRHYAMLCCKFCEQVRTWARAVFSGRVELDRNVEETWLREGTALYARALELWRHGQTAQVPCYELGGHAALLAALWDLYQLLSNWVTPRRAVGPSARRGLPLEPAAEEEVKRRLAALPPLPAEWQPADPRQQVLYRKLRNS